ncbi:HigA family addiction module antitoxin [Ruminococcus flavefaciens]|uniref:HigA family addiction module antitoxin n=1 Tax=Ruminococcus flavefaciens TaxID=1265 RepID=UPI0026F0512E|nr:HigA family addiction module antitoxin [Ruminococcus flavefaciens]
MNEHIQFHPGYYLQEIIVDMNITVEEFSEITKINKEEINSILDGKIPVNADISKKLSDALCLSEELWLNLQKHYDEFVHNER